MVGRGTAPGVGPNDGWITMGTGPVAPAGVKIATANPSRSPGPNDRCTSRNRTVPLSTAADARSRPMTRTGAGGMDPVA